MRSLALLFLVGCDGSDAHLTQPDLANVAPCDNFQSPRDVGLLGEYSSAASAGFTLGAGPNANSVAFTMPPDAYGRPGRTLNLTKCDEHFHDPIEHLGACTIPVITTEEPMTGSGSSTFAADGPPPVGTGIELHTAYSERVNMMATGLARCQGVVFVRASQWIVTDDEQSDPLAFTSVSRYAGSTTGAGNERCKPPAWWEVLEHCHVMARTDPRIAGHAHPARETQTYLSPMKRVEFF